MTDLLFFVHRHGGDDVTRNHLLAKAENTIILFVGGLRQISRDTDNNAAMYIAGGRTKGANDRSFVFVHQHGGDDVT